MKLVFMHTAEKVKTDSAGRQYTDGAYNQQVWDRYLALGCEVVFLSRSDPKKYSDKEIISKFNIIDTRIKVILVKDRYESLSSFLNLWTMLANRILILRVVRSTDCLIIRMPCNEGYLAARYSKRYKKPYLVECVGSAWDSLWFYSLKGKFLAPIKHAEMKFVVRNANRALYVTKSYLQRMYPSKARQIGCSDVQIFDRKMNVKSIRNSKIVIGTVGAVDVRYKGQQDVIASLPRIVREGFDVKYELVGGGDVSGLKNLADSLGVTDRLIFKGMLPHDKVLDWLSNDVHIYAQPSHTEALPRAVVEAMNASCACVGSRVGGIPELLSKDMLFDPGKPEQAYAVIMKLLDSQEIFSQQSIHNYERSNLYLSQRLDKKRSDFYKSFIETSTKGLQGHDPR